MLHFPQPVRSLPVDSIHSSPRKSFCRYHDWQLSAIKVASKATKKEPETTDSSSGSKNDSDFQKFFGASE